MDSRVNLLIMYYFLYLQVLWTQSFNIVLLFISNHVIINLNFKLILFIEYPVSNNTLGHQFLFFFSNLGDYNCTGMLGQSIHLIQYSTKFTNDFFIYL